MKSRNEKKNLWIFEIKYLKKYIFNGKTEKSFKQLVVVVSLNYGNCSFDNIHALVFSTYTPLLLNAHHINIKRQNYPLSLYHATASFITSTK